MKKANFTNHNIEYSRFIIIENISDLYDYFHEKLYGMMKRTAKELVERDKERLSGTILEHTKDVTVSIAELITKAKGNGCLYNNAVLYAHVQQDWIDAITNNLTIAINPNNCISYFVIKKDVKLNFINVDKYTKDDINLFKWSGGSHWYAKISLMDVVVNGEQKWNSKYVAQQKAEEFLLNLYV